MSLEHELEVYRSNLIDMLGVNDVNEGKYVVVKNDDVRGPFGTREGALAAAYDLYGTGPFLVKKIERKEAVLYFSRDLHR